MDYSDPTKKERFADSLDNETLLKILNLVLYGDIHESPWDNLSRYLTSDDGKTKEESFNEFESNIDIHDDEQTTRVNVCSTIADLLETKREIATKNIFIHFRRTSQTYAKDYISLLLPAMFSSRLNDKLTGKSVTDICDYMTQKESPIIYEEFVKLIEVENG